MKNINDIRIELKNIKDNELTKFVEKYRYDKRVGVIKLVKSAKFRLDRIKSDSERITRMLKFDNSYAEYGIVCGVDEVGRGSFAGPVVAAAVVLKKDSIINKLDDSKKLSEELREELYDEIVKESLCIGIGIVSNQVIDRLNILKATLLAMREAVSKLEVVPNIVLVDGNVSIPELEIEQKTIVKGDSKSLCIAAASVVAKVTRDRYMRKLHTSYPEYDFFNNKGYGTKSHIEKIKEYGISDVHRESFIH